MKSKKILAFLLSAVMLLSLSATFTTSVFAEAIASTAEDFIYTVDDDTTPNTVTITGLNDKNNITRADIPSVIDGKAVTKIDMLAFSNCTNLTEVNIPDSVTTISTYAFLGCNKLATVNIPKSVASIGARAFYNCTALTDFVVAADNSTYSSVDGVILDKQCTNVIMCPPGKSGTYTVPNTVTGIKSNSFSYCSKLTSVNIPKGVTTIQGYAFQSCTALTSICLPNSITQIFTNAFSSCSSLKDVYYIGTAADWNAMNISGGNDALTGKVTYLTLTLPQDLTYDGNGKQVSVSSSSADIGAITVKCYDQNNRLLSTLPTAVGTYTVKIDIAASDTHSAVSDLWVGSFNIIEAPTFTYTVNDATNNTITITGISDKNASSAPIPSTIDGKTVTKIGMQAFSGCSKLTYVSIPDTVTELEIYAFYSCGSLETINIPKSVTNISSYAFHFCNKLTDFNVNADNAVYKSVDGVIYNKQGSTLFLCPQGKSGIFTVPNGVTEIYSTAFYCCRNLTEVILPSTLNKIGVSAFSGCSKLTSINIPDGVSKIAASTFSICSKLTSINLPNSVTQIGESAFSGCSSLASITLTNSITKIDQKAFEQCNALTDVYYIGTASNLNGITIATGNDALSGKVRIIDTSKFAIVSAVADNGVTTAKFVAPTAGTYVLVFADYNSSGFNAAKSVAVTVGEDEVGTLLEKSASVTLDAGDKIMLWSSLNTIKPLCSVYETE